MEIKRIIVSRTDKIGDLILSIPSFFMVKKMYPKAELVVLVRKYNYEIVKNLPYVDRIIKIDDNLDNGPIFILALLALANFATNESLYRAINTSALK